MEGLYARARSAMNLMLLLAVLQAWVLFTDKPGLSEDIGALSADMRGVPDVFRPKSMSPIYAALDLEYQVYSQPIQLNESGEPAPPPPPPLDPRKDPKTLRAVTLSELLHIAEEDFSSSIAKIEEDEKKVDTPTVEFKLPKMDFSDVARPISIGGEVKEQSQAPQLVDPPVHSMSSSFRRPSQKDILQLEADVHVLQLAAHRSNLPPNATLGDLERESAKELDIPFVKDHIDAHVAFWVLGIAALGPSILLLSLACSIAIATNLERPAIVDWLPVHPGRLAALVGFAWIVLPGVMSAAGTLVSSEHLPFFDGANSWMKQALLPTALLVIACFILRKARAIRQQL